jgi:hypothetical protein
MIDQVLGVRVKGELHQAYFIQKGELGQCGVPIPDAENAFQPDDPAGPHAGGNRILVAAVGRNAFSECRP